MGFWEHLIAGAAVKAFSDASKETKKHNDLCWQLSDLETEFDSYLKRVGCDCVYIADWGCIDTGSIYPEKQKIESLKRKIDTYVKMGGNPKYIDDLDEIDECLEKVKYLREKGMLHRQDEFRNENDLYWIKNTIENISSQTEPTIFVDAETDTPAFGTLTVNDTRIWNPDEEAFVDHEVKIEFSTKKIVLYLVALNRELFSVDIEEGSFVETEILESDTPNKAILILANSTHILMDIKDANRVTDYYNAYHEYIEEQEDKKQQRIIEISNKIMNLDKMVLAELENVDEHILLNHDTMVCLQLMFAHKKYRSIKLADKNSVNHANTLIGIAVIKEMIDTIHKSVQYNYPEYTEEDINYATWETIKRVSIKYYSDKWEELYGKYIDTPLKQSTSSEADGTLDRYIEKILLNNNIDNNDVWVMCYFTCYMMEKGYVDGDLYYPAFFEIVVSAFSTFKRNMNLV